MSSHCDSFVVIQTGGASCCGALAWEHARRARMGTAAVVPISPVPPPPPGHPPRPGQSGSVLLITLVAFEELVPRRSAFTVVASFDAAPWYPIGSSGAALAAQLSATVVAGAL